MRQISSVRIGLSALACLAALAALCGCSAGEATAPNPQAAGADAAPSDAQPSDAQPSDAGAGDASASGDALANGAQRWMTPCPLSPQSEPGVVATSAGWVRGEKSESGWAFRGVPYAAPPVDALRWAPPQPPACWSGVRPASAFAAVCPQIDAKTAKVEGAEDCLYANVWTPSLTPDKPLPVLVFIHGGGNIQGSAAEPLAGAQHLYAGHHLAAGGAVVVTLQYRLGALGWLSLPGLDAAGGTAGNYGLLDQLALLRWVQQNIGGFGGDAKRVLVFGESAGAVDTCSLLAAPASAGLMSAALIQSGGCSQPKLAGYQQAMAAKLAKSSCAAAANPVACLRGLSAAAVVTQLPGVIGAGAVDRLGDPGRYGPVVDGVVLPKSPLEALQDGSALQVPLVVGSNAEELAQMISDEVASAAELKALIAQTFGMLGNDAVVQLQTYYDAQLFSSPQAALVQLFSDMRFVCPTRGIARAASAGRLKSGSSAGVWRYWFSRQPPTKQGALPAAHGLELLYVFGTMLDIPLYTPPAADLALSEAMRGYWTRLAGFGDPNGPASRSATPLPWPSYVVAQDNALEFGAPLKVIYGIHAARCDLWDQLAAAAAP